MGECIAIDKRGGIIVAGHTQNWNGTWDVQVIKYDSAGTYLWEAHYDGPGTETQEGDDYATSVQVDDDLNIYVSGTSWRGTANNYDFYVWKLDSTGAPVWPNSGGGTGYAFDSKGAVRTTDNNNEGFSATEGVKVDMAIRQSYASENRTIVVGGVGVTSSGDYYWHMVVFAQDSSGLVSLKAGWPVKEPTDNDYRIFPEAVAVHSDNSAYATGRTYYDPGGSPPHQRFTTIRYKSGGTTSTGSPLHWQYDWDEDAKESCGKDIVLDRDGNAFATGFVTPDANQDYATVRIERDWNGSNEQPEAIWDNGERNDEAASIDLTYEVESSVLKVYATVTGKTDALDGPSDIGTLRYDVYLTEEWVEIYDKATARKITG